MRLARDQRRFCWLVAVASVVLAAAFFVSAASASEQHTTLNELEGEVMCPTCHTTLDQSNAPIARRIEAYISRRIAAGDTKSEIEGKLVAQFGPAILAAPPHKGFDLLAWWLPEFGVLAGALLLAVSAHRWSRTRAPNAEPVIEPLDAELERRLDQELARFP
jgi:cytochrome c-type biogenesis protein CcmH/NrfF